ncbi:MAG: hypothetical protein AB1491_06865 [Thermodesulfobacteriota bacterium]
MVEIVKIPGGLGVDGLELRRGKCGCGGMGGDCCFTFSKVKREGNTLIYEGKATAPSTRNNFVWGYRVRRGEVVVSVQMEDTRDPHDYFAGCYPPPLEAWKERGWEVEEEYSRPLEG